MNTNMQSHHSPRELSAEEEHDKFLRAAAELENYKRRVRKEIESHRADAEKRILLDLVLPLIDDFERAIQAASNASGKGAVKQVREGLEMFHRKIQGDLARAGIEPFDSIGARFDPALMEAITQVHTDEVEEGHVHGEALRGYHHRGDLLRPAHVAVAKKPEQG